MTFATIDMIVRRYLLERNLPIHFYAEALFHASSAVREMAKDTLQIINTVSLPVDQDYYAADLPGDFVDEVSVSVPVGGLLRPIPKNDAINPMRSHSTETGQFEVPVNNDAVDTNGYYSYQAGIGWYWKVNSYGEWTGGYFGGNAGAYRNGYKVIRERRQIQLTSSFTGEGIVLMYVSSGQSADNATQLDWRAFQAVIAYIDWKRANPAVKDSAEGRTFYNERRLLRANMNDMDLTDLRQILHKNYTAAFKS